MPDNETPTNPYLGTCEFQPTLLHEPNGHFGAPCRNFKTAAGLSEDDLYKMTPMTDEPEVKAKVAPPQIEPWMRKLSETIFEWADGYYMRNARSHFGGLELAETIAKAHEDGCGLAEGGTPRDPDAPDSRAIEHGEYLASAAEAYMQAINEYSAGKVDSDYLSDHWRALSNAVGEFRKRAKRALAAHPSPAPTPKVSVTVHGPEVLISRGEKTFIIPQASQEAAMISRNWLEQIINSIPSPAPTPKDFEYVICGKDIMPHRMNVGHDCINPEYPRGEAKR